MEKVESRIQKVLGLEVTFRGTNANVARWEPLGEAMCDVLLAFEDGTSCWVASHELRFVDGLPFPSRSALRRRADVERDAALREIREQHVKDFNKPWPGMEFGKAHFGQMLDRALELVDAYREHPVSLRAQQELLAGKQPRLRAALVEALREHLDNDELRALRDAINELVPEDGEDEG